MNGSKLQEIASKTGAQLEASRKAITLTVSQDRLKDACKLVLSELGFYHLSTITGIDEGKTISISYHFWQGTEFLSVKTSVAKDKPVLASLTDILPAALFYEAEVKDLLGVVFEGNQMMDRKLLLPDNYPPQAPPPLRKEADPEKIRKLMELE
jgi:NADH:ubiquinone oxidoreductase subunit C